MQDTGKLEKLVALHGSETQQAVASNVVLHDAERKMYAALQTTLV